MEQLILNEEIKDAQIKVGKGETLNLNLAAFTKFPAVNINIKVADNATLNCAFADFSHGSGRFKISIDLLGESSSCQWHLASLTSKTDVKVFDCSVNHKFENTDALMSNYGICRDGSKLTFTGVSSIEKGSRKSKTRQVAKIIVFDPSSDGKASPVLRIDENDVDASHAAIVGRLNDEHLFYLQSRGIPLDEAKRLITLGYLKPIENFFSDAELVKKIDSSIEEGV